MALIVDALQEFVAARGAALVIAARNPEEELDAVFASLRRQGVVACVVNAYALIGTTSFEEVTSSMLRHRIPCIMESVTWTRNGVFMSYGESFESITKRAVDYVDRILQGSSPSDLPVSQAKDFDLSINLKTAQAMGISVPRELLLRAAEVIQ